MNIEICQICFNEINPKDPKSHQCSDFCCGTCGEIYTEGEADENSYHLPELCEEARK